MQPPLDEIGGLSRNECSAQERQNLPHRNALSPKAFVNVFGAKVPSRSSRLCVGAFACSVLSVFSVVNAFAVPDCGPARLRSLRRAQGRRGSDAAQCADASAVAALARISKLGNWSRSRSSLSRNCCRSAELRFLTSPLDWFDHWCLRILVRVAAFLCVL